MQYLIDPTHGSVYWCADGVLMFAPLRVDSTFDTDESGEVDFARLDEQDRAYMEGIKKRLC
jgi:hypothetical protein